MLSNIVSIFSYSNITFCFWSFTSYQPVNKLRISNLTQMMSKRVCLYVKSYKFSNIHLPYRKFINYSPLRLVHQLGFSKNWTKTHSSSSVLEAGCLLKYFPFFTNLCNDFGRRLSTCHPSWSISLSLFMKMLLAEKCHPTCNNLKISCFVKDCLFLKWTRQSLH